jgi:hypothetical protein
LALTARTASSKAVGFAGADVGLFRPIHALADSCYQDHRNHVIRDSVIFVAQHVADAANFLPRKDTVRVRMFSFMRPQQSPLATGCQPFIPYRATRRDRGGEGGTRNPNNAVVTVEPPPAAWCAAARSEGCRLEISRELGHGRLDVTDTYLGRRFLARATKAVAW